MPNRKERRRAAATSKPIEIDHLAQQIAEQSADQKIVVTRVLARGSFLIAYAPKDALGFRVMAIEADEGIRAACLAYLTAHNPPLTIREVDSSDEFDLRIKLLWPDRPLDRPLAH